MSTVLANRVQSAHSRSSHRSGINGQNAHLRQRPTTSLGARQSLTDIFDQTALRTLEPSNLSPPLPPPASRRRRPKTASVSTTASARPPSRKLRSDEIDNLVRSLDRDDTYIVQVDCLSEYQTLVQTIDLRRTPLDCQILCALQQRENRIVQRNACRDIRFLSLIESLAPFRIREEDEQDDSNDVNRAAVLEYPPSDLSYQYIQ